MNNPQQPQATWQIDPAKNFLITQSTVYKNDGSIWIQRTLNIQQIESDLYFPVAFDEQYHGATRDAPNTNVTRWQKATLMDVRLNPAFKSQQFQIDALNLSRDMPNITVFRKQLDGKQKLYQYRGSELIEQGATR